MICRYIDSESALDSSLKSFLPLTSNPRAFYPEIVKSVANTIPLLIELLAHENTDIALDVAEVMLELTDEDVGASGEADEDGNEDEETRAAIRSFIMALVDENCLELLVSLLERLKEDEEEADRQGVFQILGIFENFLSFEPSLAEKLGEKGVKGIEWLLKRLDVKEYDSNKQYTSEVSLPFSIQSQSKR